MGRLRTSQTLHTVNVWPTFSLSPYSQTNSVMETERNTPDYYPSPLPPPTCCTRTDSWALHCYKVEANCSTPLGCSVLCLAGLIHFNRRWCLLSYKLHSSDLTSDTQELAQMASMCQESRLSVDVVLLVVPFGLNLGSGYSISASWWPLLNIYFWKLDY